MRFLFVVRADFGSGLICPRAQTCIGSNMVRADYGSGLICPRAQTCCASPTRTPARLANSPGFKSFRCPRWRIKFSLEHFSVPSHFNLRIQPLKNSAGRVPQAADGTCEKNRKPDRVGRRGLSEPGGIFSRLPTKCCSNPWLYPWLYP
jgi:hypothetical protein